MHMMKTLAATAIGAMIWNASAQAADDFPFVPHRPFDSALVEYESTGATPGKSTLYVKGEYRAIHKSVAAQGMPRDIITTPEYVYTLDRINNVATRSDNPVRLYREEWAKASAADKATIQNNVNKFGFSMGSQLGASMEKRGGKILGRDCDKITLMGSSTCMWSDASDIPLQADLSALGGGVETAVKIDENAEIPAGTFDLPDGMKVQDSPAKAKQNAMAMQVFTALKDPEYTPEKMLGGMMLNTIAPAAGDMKMPSAQEMQKMQEGMKEMQKVMQDPEMQEMMKQMKQYQQQQ